MGNPVDEYPLVSVIMIFMNEERFIAEAIASVAAQRYSNWELLLVDDGSTDESSGIARRYAERYPDQVRYLEHPEHRNCGMSASRNLGIRHAAGKYIAFLDADDAWLPHKLERQVAFLNHRPEVGMVYGPTLWWYSWSGRVEDRTRDFVYGPGIEMNTVVAPPKLLAAFLRLEGVSPCTCSVLIRRELVEAAGGFEESFRGMYEDQAFFAKVCLKATVFASSETLSKYRQHPNSSSEVTRKSGGHIAERQRFLQWLAVYLTEQGTMDKAVWRALQGELWAIRHPRLNGVLARARQYAIATLRPARFLRRRWRSLPVIRQLRMMQFRRMSLLRNGQQSGTGTPIVRYYWDHFLRQYQGDIQGAALEIGTSETVRHHGGAAITRLDVLDLAAHSAEVTVVSDLSRADSLPANYYDCFVIQFTTHLIYDIEAALYHAIRILKPGGVLLVNFPCVDYYFPRGLDMGTGAPLFLFWWFTPIQVENLLRRAGLRGEDYRLTSFGNLFARLAYLMNVPAEELTQRELDTFDPGHPLLICARVVKPEGWTSAKPAYRDPWLPDVAPARWNPDKGHYSTDEGEGK